MATRVGTFKGKRFLIDDETGKVFFEDTGTEVTVPASVATVMGANPPTVASGLSQRALSELVGGKVAAAATADRGKVIALKKLYQFGYTPLWAGGKQEEGWFGTGVKPKRPEPWDASEDPRFAAYKDRLQLADNIEDSIRLFSDMISDKEPTVSRFGMDRLNKLTTIISGGGSAPDTMGVSVPSMGAGGSYIGNKEWWGATGGMHPALTPEKGSLQYRKASSEHHTGGAAELKKRQEAMRKSTNE